MKSAAIDITILLHSFQLDFQNSPQHTIKTIDQIQSLFEQKGVVLTMQVRKTMPNLTIKKIWLDI